MIYDIIIGGLWKWLKKAKEGRRSDKRVKNRQNGKQGTKGMEQ